MIFTSTVLGYFVDRRFLLLTTAVFGFFAQHSLGGWCPALPILRRYGVRTMREIERAAAARAAVDA